MADDPDLEAIKQKRMQQLMSQYGGPGGGAPLTPEAQQQQEEQKQAAEERRSTMLHAVLQPSARERLARIALVKPDKSRAAEDFILRMAQRGQVVEKVSEEKLISILEQMNEQAGPARTKVTIQRRRTAFEDQ